MSVGGIFLYTITSTPISELTPFNVNHTEYVAPQYVKRLDKSGNLFDVDVLITVDVVLCILSNSDA